MGKVSAMAYRFWEEDKEMVRTMRHRFDEADDVVGEAFEPWLYSVFRQEDVTYAKEAAGWVEGVYYPREAQVQARFRSSTDVSSFLEEQDGVRKLHSRVWQEIEEKGYGVYYYEETLRLFTEFSGINYEVKVDFVNPTAAPYTCHIRLNGVVKEDSVTVEPGEERSVTFTACMTDGRFELSFPIGAMSDIYGDVLEGDVYIKDISIRQEAAKEKRSKPHIFLVSDSTVQSYEARSYPQTGWGQVLYQFFQGAEQCSFPAPKTYELPGLVIENHAIAGRSARSFYDEGRLDKIMEALCPGDFMLVQFAHNDDNAMRPNRYIAPEEFPAFLQRYVDACTRRGAQCILVTPITMRITDENGKFIIAFNNYREKMIELAKEKDIPLIDLGEATTAYLNEIGEEESKNIYLCVEEGEYPDGAFAAGVSDKAHLQEYGAKVYANMVARLITEYHQDGRLDELKKLAAPTDVSEIEKPVRKAKTLGSDNAESQGVVTGFVALEISVDKGSGRGSFLLNWNQAEAAVSYHIYARKKGESVFGLVKIVTREEKEAYATLPFSAEAGFLWEYCAAAVFTDGSESPAGRVIEVDLRGA